MKLKRTLLDDLEKIYHSIQCDYEYCSCKDCSNKRLCDKVYYLIYSIKNYY